MDCDPRDYDSRDDDRFAPTRDRGGLDRDDERDDEWSQPAAHTRATAVTSPGPRPRSRASFPRVTCRRARP